MGWPLGMAYTSEGPPRDTAGHDEFREVPREMPMFEGPLRERTRPGPPPRHDLRFDKIRPHRPYPVFLRGEEFGHYCYQGWGGYDKDITARIQSSRHRTA